MYASLDPKTMAELNAKHEKDKEKSKSCDSLVQTEISAVFSPTIGGEGNSDNSAFRLKLVDIPLEHQVPSAEVSPR